MPQNQYLVERPAYTRQAFDEIFHTDKDREPSTCRQRLSKAGEGVKSWAARKLTRKKVTSGLQSFLPVTTWLRKYKPRQYLADDVITGMTVAIMMVPQSMGYAQIANLPPITGLYSSFFSLIIYFLMGTSRHISVAPAAIIAWMTGTAVLTHGRILHLPPTPGANITGFMENDTDVMTTTLATTTTTSGGLVDLPADEDIPPEIRIMVATAVSMLVGIFELCMGGLRLGFITLYLSDSLTDGFVTGSALYIITSQLKYVFGVTVPPHEGALKLMRTWYSIASQLGSTHVPELVIAVSCIVVLYVVKVFINKRFKLRIPIPIDFVLVVALTCLSYFFRFKQTFEVKILETIPMGIPAPRMPSLEVMNVVVIDAIIMAITAYAFTISVAQHLAKKHNYRVNANQELLALGVDSVVCSLFSGFTPAASMSRSLLQESLGGKTQVASAVGSTVILSVLLYFGQYLETLPNAVLAAVIIVAMRSTFEGYRKPVHLWRKSKVDFFVWIVTYLGVVLLEVHIGLIIGIGFSLLTVVVRTQFSRGVLLGKIPHTDIYENVKFFPGAEETPGIKVFRYESDINYVNKDFFASKLSALTGIAPKTERVMREKAVRRAKKAAKDAERERRKNVDDDENVDVTVVINDDDANGNAPTSKKQFSGKTLQFNEMSIVDNLAFELGDGELNMGNNNGDGNSKSSSDIVAVTSLDDVPPTSVRFIIIDCSMIVHIDLSGSEALANVVDDYKSIGITVYLAHCQLNVIRALQRMDFFERMPRQHLYMSIHDAVLHCNEEGMYEADDDADKNK